MTGKHKSLASTNVKKQSFDFNDNFCSLKSASASNKFKFGRSAVNPQKIAHRECDATELTLEIKTSSCDQLNDGGSEISMIVNLDENSLDRNIEDEDSYKMFSGANINSIIQNKTIVTDFEQNRCTNNDVITSSGTGSLFGNTDSISSSQTVDELCTPSLTSTASRKLFMDDIDSCIVEDSCNVNNSTMIKSNEKGPFLKNNYGESFSNDGEFCSSQTVDELSKKVNCDEDSLVQELPDFTPRKRKAHRNILQHSFSSQISGFTPKKTSFHHNENNESHDFSTRKRKNPFLINSSRNFDCNKDEPDFLALTPITPPVETNYDSARLENDKFEKVEKMEWLKRQTKQNEIETDSDVDVALPPLKRNHRHSDNTNTEYAAVINSDKEQRQNIAINNSDNLKTITVKTKRRKKRKNSMFSDDNLDELMSCLDVSNAYHNETLNTDNKTSDYGSRLEEHTHSPKKYDKNSKSLQFKSKEVRNRKNRQAYKCRTKQYEKVVKPEGDDENAYLNTAKDRGCLSFPHLASNKTVNNFSNVDASAVAISSSMVKNGFVAQKNCEHVNSCMSAKICDKKLKKRKSSASKKRLINAVIPKLPQKSFRLFESSTDTESVPDTGSCSSKLASLVDGNTGPDDVLCMCDSSSVNENKNDNNSTLKNDRLTVNNDLQTFSSLTDVSTSELDDSLDWLSGKPYCSNKVKPMAAKTYERKSTAALKQNMKKVNTKVVDTKSAYFSSSEGVKGVPSQLDTVENNLSTSSKVQKSVNKFTVKHNGIHQQSTKISLPSSGRKRKVKIAPYINPGYWERVTALNIESHEEGSSISPAKNGAVFDDYSCTQNDFSCTQNNLPNDSETGVTNKIIRPKSITRSRQQTRKPRDNAISQQKKCGRGHNKNIKETQSSLSSIETSKLMVEAETQTMTLMVEAETQTMTKGENSNKETKTKCSAKSRSQSASCKDKNKRNDDGIKSKKRSYSCNANINNLDVPGKKLSRNHSKVNCSLSETKTSHGSNSKNSKKPVGDIKSKIKKSKKSTCNTSEEDLPSLTVKRGRKPGVKVMGKVVSTKVKKSICDTNKQNLPSLTVKPGRKPGVKAMEKIALTKSKKSICETNEQNMPSLTVKPGRNPDVKVMGKVASAKAKKSTCNTSEQNLPSLTLKPGRKSCVKLKVKKKVLSKKVTKKRRKHRLDANLFDTPEKQEQEVAENLDNVFSLSTSGFSDDDHDYPSSESQQDTLSESSSDEELPVVFSRSPTAIASTKFIERGALVWTKFSRFPFWPTLINHVYKKKLKITKVSVIFLSLNGIIGSKGVTLHFKPGRILPFGLCGDNQLYNQLKAQGVNYENSENFLSAFQQAENFLMLKAKGNTVDAFEYFQKEFSFAVSGDEEEEREESNANNDPVTSLELINEEMEQVPNDQSTDDDSVISSPSVSPENPKISDDPFVQKRFESNERLVRFIAGPETKAYLLKIYDRKKPSELHDLFNKPNKTREDKAQLKAESAKSGPIADDMHQDEIIAILMEISRETDLDNYERTGYVFSVWRPEAIIYAVQKVGKMSKKKAVARFNRGPRWSQEELTSFTENLMKSKHNIDPEDRLRYQQSRERNTKALFK